MKLSDRAINFTDQLVSNCKLDSLSIFLCDKTEETARLDYFYHVGVSDEAQIAYREKKVFEHDPYSDIDLRERTEFRQSDAFLRLSEINAAEQKYEDYWKFLSAYQVRVVGALTRRFAQGLYLTIGVHCRDGQHNPSDVPLGKLESDLDILMSLVADGILMDMVKNRAGFTVLQNVLSGNVGSATDQLFNALTPREIEISSLVSKGRQNKQIAYELGLSEYTVDNHLRRIYRKAGVRNRTSLAAILANVH